MKQDASAGDHGLRKLAEAARFPQENPNPVFRVSADGRLLYANPASRPLLASWGVVVGGSFPSVWSERIAAVLESGQAQKWDARCDDRVLHLHCVPIEDSRYVNVYASDVTELRQARDELEARVQELEALLNLLPTGIGISHDTACRDIRVNPALAQMLAMSPEANVSLSAGEDEREAQYRVFDQHGRELTLDELPMQAAAARGTEVRDLVIDIARDDGVRLTLLSYAVPLPDATGKPRGSVGAYVDITALRAAQVEEERLLAELRERSRTLELANEEIRALNAGLEQRVQERTAELEAIFDSVPDALCVADANGILRCNQIALRAFGCNSVEELRVKLPDLAQQMQSRYAITGELIPPAELGLARVLRGERVVLETITRRPTTGEDQIHRVTAGPIIMNGNIVAAVALASDITEQNRVQQQLAYQATLLSRVSDAVIATDLESCITLWNPAAEKMFGWQEAEVLGRPIEEFLPADFLDTSPTEVYRQLEEKGEWRGELLITRRDGSQVYVEAIGGLVRDATGRVVGHLGVDRDITRRKEAEAQNARLLQELRASREELRALSRRVVTMQESERSYVADQLYNQAGQVLAALQLQLSQLAKAGEPSQARLAEVQASLSEAIRELHDLAARLRPVGLDRSTLASVLNAYLAEFGRTHGVAVQFCKDETETLRAPADVGTALFRCVQEGLENVARHARATEVSLRLSRDATRLTAELVDNGVGFDPDHGSDGGGLGLASVRERLETVGGRLAITSGSGGTVLRMVAPLVAEEH